MIKNKKLHKKKKEKFYYCFEMTDKDLVEEELRERFLRTYQYLIAGCLNNANTDQQISSGISPLIALNPLTSELAKQRTCLVEHYKKKYGDGIELDKSHIGKHVTKIASSRFANGNLDHSYIGETFFVFALGERDSRDASNKETCFGCGITSNNMSRCVKCKIACYCSKKCQIDNWNDDHEYHCEEGLEKMTVIHVTQERTFGRKTKKTIQEEILKGWIVVNDEKSNK